MIRGACLCGGVRFGIARAVGPFEPDKHIFVELAPPWLEVADGSPQRTADELVAWRHQRGRHERGIVRPNLGEGPRPSLLFSRER